MFLITTADQRFWQVRGPVLFLGEWCKLYEQKHIWQSLDSQILPYHWDDRIRLDSDRRYLMEVYERYLEALAARMNHVHSLEQTQRFWRIVIGPWLQYFVEIFYDRFLSICQAADSGKISDTRICDTGPMPPPLDFPAFNQLFSSDSYNHYLYSWLIERMQSLPFHVVACNAENRSLPAPRLLKRRLINTIASITHGIFPGVHKIVLIESQLPHLELTRLQLTLHQPPYIVGPVLRASSLPVQEDMRSELALQMGRNPFEKLLDLVIPRQMPTAHVEGFQDLRRRALRTFPRKPEVILTSNAESFDEAFKLWAATYVDKGASLLVSQHGGYWGTGLPSATEDHQIKISDRFYSWGWSREGTDNVKPMPGLKLVGIERRIQSGNSGRILWALTSMPRYSYRLLSIPIAGQFLSYIEDQFRLAAILDPDIRRRVLLRLYPDIYGWDEEARWRDRFPEIETYRGHETMEQQLLDSSLFIGTYNATTILETIAANYPTILFWNPSLWELRPEAQPYFDALKDLEIFHTSPESAAAKIREVWKEPLSWWNLPELQRARKQFCAQFARTSRSWKDEWQSELRSVGQGKL